jgi:hypothetical protein
MQPPWTDFHEPILEAELLRGHAANERRGEHGPLLHTESANGADMSASESHLAKVYKTRTVPRPASLVPD